MLVTFLNVPIKFIVFRLDNSGIFAVCATLYRLIFLFIFCFCFFFVRSCAWSMVWKWKIHQEWVNSVIDKTRLQLVVMLTFRKMVIAIKLPNIVSMLWLYWMILFFFRLLFRSFSRYLILLHLTAHTLYWLMDHFCDEVLFLYPYFFFSLSLWSKQIDSIVAWIDEWMACREKERIDRP